MAARGRRLGASPAVRAGALALPLVAFIAVSFLIPLGTMVSRSVYDPLVADALPETVAALDDWDGEGIPDDATFAAAARELRRARQERSIGQIASRLNQFEAGLRGVITRTGRALAEPGGASGEARAILAAIDPIWEAPDPWRAIRATGTRFTDRHYLGALDLMRDSDGQIRRQPPDQRIYLPLLWRTLRVSLTLTALALLLGYPVARWISEAPPRRARLLLLLVLVPFWTSLLVRTTAWIVLLQNQGVLNDLLAAVGFVPDDGRLELVYNMTGTLVAMTHVLLPFMILPLYSVMRAVPPQTMRAARSLGATGFQAFWRVYWPQTLPGVGAGCLLVFILAVGFYITPALVGGASGQLISSMIAFHMETSLDWGLAAALGAILLLAVSGLYLLYDRFAGTEGLRLG